MTICHTFMNILHSSSADEPVFALMELNRGSLPKWLTHTEKGSGSCDEQTVSFLLHEPLYRFLCTFFCSVLKYTVTLLFINCLTMGCSTWQVELQSRWQHCHNVYCLCERCAEIHKVEVITEEPGYGVPVSHDTEARWTAAGLRHESSLVERWFANQGCVNPPIIKLQLGGAGAYYRADI